MVAAPVFPHSCSTATTNVSERLVNITQSAFAKLGDGHGLAEGGTGLGAGMAVLSGKDHRRSDARYVNRMMLSTNGGPASPTADGWVNYAIPVIAGLMYRDSVEIDELKHPFRVESLGIVTDSAGAGRFRGAPAQELVYTPLENPVQAIIPCDGQFAPPRGVNGGHNGTPGSTHLINHNGDVTKLPNVVNVHLQKGQKLRGRDSSRRRLRRPADARSGPRPQRRAGRLGVDRKRRATSTASSSPAGSRTTASRWTSPPPPRVVPSLRRPPRPPLSRRRPWTSSCARRASPDVTRGSRSTSASTAEHRRHRAAISRPKGAKWTSAAGWSRPASSRLISTSTSRTSSTAARPRRATSRKRSAKSRRPRRQFTPEDVYTRAKRTLERCIFNGTMHMRTQLEVDPGIGLRGLEGVLPLIDEYKWAIDIEICIFPQEGLPNNPGTDELMVEALKRGGKVVGAAPYTDTNAKAQMDRVFEMAREFDIDIDMHLDFAPTPDNLDLMYVCELAEKFQYGGRVAIGHVTKLSAAAPEAFEKAARRMADAGVALTVLPSTDLYLMGRHMDHSVMRGVTAGAQAAAFGRQLLALDQQRAQPVHAVRRLLADPHGEPLRQHLPGRRARRRPRMLQHDHRALGQAHAAATTTASRSARRRTCWCSTARTPRPRSRSWSRRCTASSAAGRPSRARRSKSIGRSEGVKAMSSYEERGYGEQPVGFGEKPGIVVVDFQRAFTDPAFSTGGAPLVRRAVENTARLLKVARAAGVPVAACYMGYHCERDAPHLEGRRHRGPARRPAGRGARSADRRSVLRLRAAQGRAVDLLQHAGGGVLCTRIASTP